MEERMKKGYLWTDTGEYLEEQNRAKDLMYEFNHTRPSETEKRETIIKEMFGTVGDPVWIMQPVTLARGKTVHIGKRTYINSNLTLVDNYEIYIGEECLIAPNVTICTTGHPVHPELRKNGEMYSFPVKIGNKVWIGAGAIILPGVTIGDNTVIGAGSIVTKDVPANVIALGNPCKVLREITGRGKEYYYRDLRVDMQIFHRLTLYIFEVG